MPPAKAASSPSPPVPSEGTTPPDWLTQLLQARRASTSLVGITTLDARAAITQATTALLRGTDAEAPVLEWDITRGAIGITPTGEAALKAILPKDLPADQVTGALPEFLAMAAKLPTRTICFFHNVQMYLDNPGVRQGFWNLRDAWMAKKCMAVMLGNELPLPPELVNDVLIFEEPAPSDDALAKIAAARLATPDTPADPDMVKVVVQAARGVGSEFMADQICAMSIKKGKANLDELWLRKRQAINAIKGLSVYTGTPTRLGGLGRLKTFAQQALDHSPTGRPDAFVFVDEVEKSLGGAGTAGYGDSSGVSQDQLGQLLRMTEDWESLACLFLGVGGVAKTAFVRWFATETNTLMIDMDLGAMKGSYVGQSEQQIRMASRTLKGISGGRPGALWFFFVCNKLEVLPPEFKRRMNMGMWFFDLPTPAERTDIWSIHRERYRIAAGDPLPKDSGWTGAEIRNCCQIAWRLGVPLTEAATYIVPLVASEGGADGAIERLHRLADHRFLNVNTTGQYNHKASCPNAEGSTVPVAGQVAGRVVDEE